MEAYKWQQSVKSNLSSSKRSYIKYFTETEEEDPERYDRSHLRSLYDSKDGNEMER